jgi:hypothetical protein
LKKIIDGDTFCPRILSEHTFALSVDVAFTEGMVRIDQSTLEKRCLLSSISIGIVVGAAANGIAGAVVGVFLFGGLCELILVLCLNYLPKLRQSHRAEQSPVYN